MRGLYSPELEAQVDGIWKRYQQGKLDLAAAQRAVLDDMREMGLDIDAETYAQIAFGRDIEELGAEELGEIPQFLLDKWLAEQESEDKA